MDHVREALAAIAATEEIDRILGGSQNEDRPD